MLPRMKQQLRWSNAGLINSWVPFANRTPQYSKTEDGVVLMRGILTGGSSMAFYLPEEFRPRRPQFLSAVCANATTYHPGLLIVDTTGTVTPSFTLSSGSLAYFSLDGLSFHTSI